MLTLTARRIYYLVSFLMVYCTQRHESKGPHFSMYFRRYLRFEFSATLVRLNGDGFQMRRSKRLTSSYGKYIHQGSLAFAEQTIVKAT